ncbi:MAG: Clp protease N-terminal domain-containing protein [Candidatus Sericytochromatia bacterium]
MFESLSQNSIKIVMLSQEEAKKLRSAFVEPEHIILALLKSENTSIEKIFSEKSVNYDIFYEKVQANSKIRISSNRFETPFSPLVKQAVEIANNEIEKLSLELIEPEHLLLGIINLGEGLSINLLKEIGIDIRKIKWQLLRTKAHVQDYENLYPNLTKFTIDIIKKIELGETEPIINKNDLIENIIPYFNLYHKKYPIIIGKKGVGKSALVTGIGQYILDGKIYNNLQNIKLLELDFYTINFEAFNNLNETFKNIFSEAKLAKDIIFVFDNFENLFFPELKKDFIENILLKSLLDKDFKALFICEHDIYFNKVNNSILAKYFQPIIIQPTSKEESKMILLQHKEKLSHHYNIDVDDSSIEKIIEHSKNINDTFLPKSALDLLDLAMSKKKLNIILAQGKIRELEKNLRGLRSKKEKALENNDLDILEEIKQEAQIYEDGIKILKNNFSSSIRSTLTVGEVKLLLGKEFNGE